MYPPESRRGSGLRNSGGQAYDVGLQRRSFIFGLHDDLSIATEHVCTILGDWVSQARKRFSKETRLPGKN